MIFDLKTLELNEIYTDMIHMNFREYLIFLIEKMLQKDTPADTESFVEEVLDVYIKNLYLESFFIDLQKAQEVKEELRNEIIEIYRIKTYGYYSLDEYRKEKLKKAE